MTWTRDVAALLQELTADGPSAPPAVVVGRLWALVGDEPLLYGSYSRRPAHGKPPSGSGTIWELLAVTATKCAVVTAGSDEDLWTFDDPQDEQRAHGIADMADFESWARPLHAVAEVSTLGEAANWSPAGDSRHPRQPAWRVTWSEKRQVVLPQLSRSRLSADQHRLTEAAAKVVDEISRLWAQAHSA
jgi:hypothetical protein